MRIAYFVYWDVSHETGVLKKINSQIRAWQHSDHTVKLFAVSFGNGIWAGLKGIPVEWIFCPAIPSRFPNTWRLINKVIEWKPDVVYLRFNFYYPGLDKLCRNVPVIVEINADDLSEYRLISKTRYYYNLMTRDILFQRVHGFVFVSYQILERFAAFTQPKVVIGNGIDLSQYSVLPAPQNENPHLVFLGSPNQPWQGIDKLLWLSRIRPDWHFDLIGLEQPKKNSTGDTNLCYHGYLEKEQYEPIMANADIGVGTLALYRIKLQERSSLKLGEYLAYGIPTIIAHRDTNLPIPKPFLLQLPNTEDNMECHLDMVVRFVNEWKGKRVPRDEIAHLDIAIKEHERLRFIDHIIQTHSLSKKSSVLL